MEFAILGALAIVLGLAAWIALKLRTAPPSGSVSNDRIENALRVEMAQNRKEMSEAIKNFNDSMLKSFSSLGDSSEAKLEALREAVDKQLRGLQESNERKLEQMRSTVDEKLQKTLESRLGESFRLVSERLAEVQKGLGEMQSLAAGVGDLKKVLSNVKTRGLFGELQLENLLEQFLIPDQYAKNVATKQGSADKVEFAIRMPGGDEGPVWLPVDSKFPSEYYERYINACDGVDLAIIETTKKELAAQLLKEAKSIREKYIDPPHTTDFAVLFLPFESLYADVVRMGLLETMQRDWRVMIAGPSTFSAFLNSLQMGFRTLAIQKRSSEVWTLLGIVKAEFGKFGGILEATHKKLESATKSIQDAASKSRTIERKLRDVGQSQIDSADGAEEIPGIEEPDSEKVV